MRNNRSGMTLVEVLLAAMLLGLGMMTIFTSISRCLKLLQASRDVHKMQLVFDLGDITYPLAGNITSSDDMEKLEVEDDQLVEGFVFNREFDIKEKPEDDSFDDHLFTVRTTVSWGEGEDAREQHVQYIWLPNIDEYVK